MSAPEIIVFPDVEQILCDWLTTGLAAHGWAIPVATRVPNPRPAQFLRLLLTGGTPGAVFVIDAPTLTVEAWAALEGAAATLIQLARGLLASLPGQTVAGTTFYRATAFAGPANLPDPDSDQVRYTYSVSLLLRGSAL